MVKLLSLKGGNGINEFLNYLSIHYSWIADPIKKSIKNAYNDNAFLTKLQSILRAGDVPQLSLRHISRTEHVSKNV